MQIYLMQSQINTPEPCWQGHKGACRTLGVVDGGGKNGFRVAGLLGLEKLLIKKVIFNPIRRLWKRI